MAVLSRTDIDAKAPYRSGRSTEAPRDWLCQWWTTSRGGPGGARSLGRCRVRWLTGCLLAFGDFVSYIASGFLLIAVVPVEDPSTVAHLLLLVAVAAIMSFASVSLYPGYRLYGFEHLRRRALAAGRVAAIGLFGAWLMGRPDLGALIAAYLLAAGAMQPLLTTAMRRTSRLLGLWGESAAIIASENSAAVLRDYFERNWCFGLVPAQAMAAPDPHQIALVASGTTLSPEELKRLRESFAEVLLLADLPVQSSSGVRPREADGTVAIRMTGLKPSASSVLSRIIDLAIAIPAFLVLTPVMLLAAVGVYLSDPGPVLFRHRREGLGGQTIHVLKIRTMYMDAEARLASLLSADTAVAAEWKAHFKLRKDPRVLPFVGKFLRSTSLDEVPQLLNVIAGEMSIVGPRPFPDYHLTAMNPDFRRRRASIRPGLTGFWQISERSDADLDLQQSLDEFYLHNRSLWFDCHILLNTIPAIFKRNGAY